MKPGVIRLRNSFLTATYDVKGLKIANANQTAQLIFVVTNMKTSSKSGTATVILAVCIFIIIGFIKVSSFYPDWIEKYYSRGIYPPISWFHRKIFGWLPFSIGDFLYAFAGIYLLVKFIKVIKVITGRGLKTINYRRSFVKTFFILGAIYIYFNVAWGLNYNRPGIATQLKLNPEMYNEQDLETITGILLDKVNANRLSLGTAPIQFKPYVQVFDQAQKSYQSISGNFPFLAYNTSSIKRSWYGTMGNYLGFLGYYNPFTGEAQLNLTMPRFLIPFVACHEMAHQLGYASESEANFVGYLAAVHSRDTLFHYSAYFDLFNYANHELFLRDSIQAKNNSMHLDTLVKKDFVELREYWRKSENVVEPLIRIFYDNYLKANQQMEGVKSYNQVVGWLIAYYKKYGKI
jgi:hypothetical protein